MASRQRQNYWEDHGPEQAIEERWPYDGPHSPETIINAAYGLERLVRYINNASQYPSRFDQPWQVHDTLLGLHGALYGLGQLLEQADNALNHLGTPESTGLARAEIFAARRLLGVPPGNAPFAKPGGLVDTMNKAVLAINKVEKREAR